MQVSAMKTTENPTRHPGLHHIHLGGDEVWQLATCCLCRERTGNTDEGKIALYLMRILHFAG